VPAVLALWALLFGPAAAAYLVLPPEVLAAWPVMIIGLAPSIAGLLAGLVSHAWRPGLELPLATTADGWLRDELARRGRIGIGVAAMERGEDRESFFHPASNTIILAEDVLGAHDPRAHATAAHELGHALLHLDRPLLSRVLIAARREVWMIFPLGAGLLLGATLVGGAGLRLVAIGLMALAVVLLALVVVDETVASTHARRMLHEHLGDDGARAAARADLRRALATYGLPLLAMIGAVVAAALLDADPDGVLVRTDVLGTRGRVAVDIVSGVTVASATGAVALALLPSTGRIAATAHTLGVAAMLWCPLLVALLCDVAGAPAWAVACAVVPAWGVLSTPPLAIVRALASRLGRDVTRASRPLAVGGAAKVRRVGKAALAGDEPVGGVLVRLFESINFLWPAPLALWWMMSR
jgi:Zn-dependent membrane protease YugP